MLIDHTHRRWFMGSAVGLAAAIAIYIPYSVHSPQGSRGGSVVGLIYGSVGFAFMLFAGLLGLRKKFPIWRVGRAQTWMRGHLWLGLVSYPVILCHSAFSMGNGLTRALMWIFSFVIGSGIVGAALQHYMPEMITDRVPLETIYNQIDRVQGQLLKESDNLMSSLAE